MTTIHPWINFNGNAEEAFTFYRSVFGGEFTNITRFKDLASDAFPVAPEDENKLMRIALPIGTNTVLTGNDVPAFMGTVNERENRSKILVTTESQADAERIFAGLSAGGDVEVPLEPNAEGTGFCMFRDKFGIEWIVEYTSST